MRDEVFRTLAASGKYHNTGKVLIGLTYSRYNLPVMGPNELLIQQMILEKDRPKHSFKKNVEAAFFVVFVVALSIIVSFT